MKETRTYVVLRSNVTEDTEPGGFDNSARSRLYDENDSKTSDFNISVTSSVTNVPVQPGGVKKRGGNLKVFEDAAY